MAIKAPIELYRRSIPEGLKTKDLFFVALQDKLTVIKPKELNKNGIKIHIQSARVSYPCGRYVCHLHR